MKKLALIFLVLSYTGFTARAAEMPAEKNYLFSAKVADTRQSGVFVSQGKKPDDTVSLITSAMLFKEPQEFSLEGSAPTVGEPVRSFVVARQYWKKADDVRYLDCWHSTTHTRIKAMIAKTKTDPDMAKRLGAARSAAKTVTVLAVVRLAQGTVVVIREQGKAEAHFMVQQTDRWRLGDLTPRSVNDLSAAIIEAALSKGSVVPAPDPVR